MAPNYQTRTPQRVSPQSQQERRSNEVSRGTNATSFGMFTDPSRLARIDAAQGYPIPPMNMPRVGNLLQNQNTPRRTPGLPNGPGRVPIRAQAPSNAQYQAASINGRESRFGHTPVDSTINSTLLTPSSQSQAQRADQRPAQSVDHYAPAQRTPRTNTAARATQAMTLTQAFMSMRQYLAASSSSTRTDASNIYRPPHLRSISPNNLALGTNSMDEDDSEEDSEEDDLEDDCSETNTDDFAHVLRRARQQAPRMHRFFDNDSQGITDSQTEDVSSHSQFRCKIVCELKCRFCTRFLCNRAMKAILLADTKVELYSTDLPPLSDVEMVNKDYVTDNCKCRIHDIACLGCGNIVGYHVTQPCTRCLDSCNNGHFWMFQTEGVTSEDRFDASGTKPLLWAFLPSPEQDKPKEFHARTR